jgi:hypothetical protein
MAKAADLSDDRSKGSATSMSTTNGQGVRREKTEAPSPTPPDTSQDACDAEQKRKNSSSENALESTQDKNPIPPGSVR